MKRVQAFGGLVLLMAFGVTRAGTPSVGDLIDAEATRTLHQMTNDDKSSANGGPLPGGAALAGPTAPLPAVPAPADEKPRHPDGLFARFGVVPNLSGYLMWNNAVYQVFVGKKVKGWTVIAINADGADLRSAKGVIKHFDSLVDSGFDGGDGGDGASATQAQPRNTVAIPQASMPPGLSPMLGARPSATVGVR